MLRIFRETVGAKVGNIDQIHSYLVDLMLATHNNRGKNLKLDVMDFMWHDMYNACITRRSPPYAPYVFALIVSKSDNVRKGLSAMKLTTHKPKSLQIGRAHV